MTTVWVGRGRTKTRLPPAHTCPSAELLWIRQPAITRGAGHPGDIPPQAGAVTMATRQPSYRAWGGGALSTH